MIPAFDIVLQEVKTIEQAAWIRINPRILRNIEKSCFYKHKAMVSRLRKDYFFKNYKKR